MSWQPVVAETLALVSVAGMPGLPPSGKSTGKLTTAEASGLARGTLATEIPSCGGRQSRLVGTNVWVCEPQSVSTAATYPGLPCR